MTEDRAKIIATLKKLREFRVDRGATESEADTAKRLVDKLVEKYSVTEEEINRSAEPSDFMDDVFGGSEGFEHVRSKGGMSGTFTFNFGNFEEDSEVKTTLDDFLKGMMGTGLGSFFDAMREVAGGPSSFEEDLFRTIDALLKAWGKEGDRKREDNREDPEAPDSIEG